MNGKEDVWSIVEEFRSTYPLELSDLPVDVLTVIEIHLRLDVIPFDNLFRKYSVDAAIVPDFSGIYVDKRSYQGLEGTPPWLFNRLRFSLAHELGHIIMHKELAPNGGFKSLEDFWAWMRTYNEQRYGIEQQANEFAGRLLVPLDRLSSDFDTFSEKIKVPFPNFWTNSSLRNGFIESLAQTYGLSEGVIAVRLERDEIWPER